MKTVKLNRLTIENFKGITATTIDFGGDSCTIYGNNAAGKSTVNDAWHWLLFGKNRKGLTTFNIKPLDSDGNVRDPGAVTSVTASVHVNGEPLELRRTYYEKWSQKRGSADKTFDGNTSDFYIDGIPCKKHEYDAKITELIADENVFMLVTNLYAFNEKLSMQSRRKVLFELCGTMTDGELIRLSPELAPLGDAVGRYTVDDYRKKLQSDRRTLNEDRNKIPTRIDECLKTVSVLKDIDFDEMKKELTVLSEEREKVSSELVRLENDSITAELRNELTARRNELTDLENRNRVHRSSQLVPVDNSAEELHRMKLSTYEKDVSTLKQQKMAIENEVTGTQEKVSRLRAKWSAIEDETLDQDTSCPTCGREYDEESLARARREFDEAKSKRQNEVVAEAEKAKAEIVRLTAEITKIESAVSEAVKLLEKTKSEYIPAQRTTVEISDLPEYESNREKLVNEISDINSQLTTVMSGKETTRNRLKETLSRLRYDSDRLSNQIASECVLKTTSARIDELRQAERSLAAKIEENDKMQYLCEEFVRFKVSFVEESVNSKFRLARFKLFDVQVNGALVDCCDATYDGVPYEDINNGMAVNLGLDIIETISSYYGVRVPLFVDNAESVTKMITIDTQTIKLAVSEKDKELRCEIEEEKYEPEAEPKKGIKYTAA